MNVFIVWRKSRNRESVIIGKLILPLVIIGASVVIIGAIAALKPSPEVDAESLADSLLIEVVVRPLRRQSVSLWANSQGTVSPKREIDLVSEVSGRVVRVADSFEDGAFFDADTVLIDIDDRDYRAAHQRALAELASAERALAEEEGRASQAVREWRELGDVKANELFLRKPQLAEARSKLNSAEANLSIAELNLKRTKINAPFSGRVRETFVDLGQYVAVGSPLASVYDTSVAEIRLSLTDRQLAILKLPLGRAAEDGPEVQLSATIGGQEYQWTGAVTRTEASVDTQSRMYYAIAEVENPYGHSDTKSDLPLMPGLFVSARISGRLLENVIALPREALVRRQYVYVLDDSDIVEIEPVEVIKKSEKMAWILSDLPEGTRIVLDKQTLISPGMAVQPAFESGMAGLHEPPVDQVH